MRSRRRPLRVRGGAGHTCCPLPLDWEVEERRPLAPLPRECPLVPVGVIPVPYAGRTHNGKAARFARSACGRRRLFFSAISEGLPTVPRRVPVCPTYRG